MSLKVAVIGAGGVGGYYGARLLAGGADVTFLARGANLEALRKSGLEIEYNDGRTEHFAVRAVTNEELSRHGPYDLVLWCVKTYQNADASEGLDPIATPGSFWLPLQNGVETEDFLKVRFPQASVLGGSSYVSVLVDAPGKIRHYGSGLVRMGHIAGFAPKETAAPMLERVRAAFDAGGVKAMIEDDIRAVKWNKLLWNASLNTLSAISGVKPYDLLSHEPTRELVRAAMYETVDVARALGIAVDRGDADRHIQVTQTLPELRTSMMWDVAHGRPIEHEALCGVVVGHGKGRGVPTPNLERFYTLLSLYEDRRRGES